MICGWCSKGVHLNCQGSTTCYCQHRVGSVNVDVPKKADNDDEETKE